MPMRRMAELVGRSVSTIGRLPASLGLSSLKALEPVRPIVRYGHVAPGERLHIDSEKPRRIVRPSHRVTSDRRDSISGAGWEFAHVAIDDHSRAGLVQMHPDERKGSAIAFLEASVAHYAARGEEDQAAAGRQRPRLPLQALQQDLPSPRHQAHLHPALHATNKWQGRALHPNPFARVGLRAPVAQQQGKNVLATRVPRPLQLPPTLGYWLQASCLQTWREQPVDHQQLVNSLLRCHVFVPTPRERRLGTKVDYLRTNSKNRLQLPGCPPSHAAPSKTAG